MDFYYYFRVHHQYFFQWEEDTEVLAIPEGSTIAYREYIIDVLEKLAPQGLPRFGTLLLTILATTNAGKSNVLAIEKIIENLELDKDFRFNVIYFLQALAHLPQKYKEGNNRLMLFQTLFTNVHNAISHKESRGFIKQLKEKNYEAYKLKTEKKELTKNVYYQDFRIIEFFHQQFPDTESIIRSLANIPDIDPETLDLDEEIPQTKSVSNLVDALVENNKTFHIGSLIKHIWGGLNIPFHNILPSQQPMGGFSDLTNKGDFDRLLISEFANDDLILLSRLANNEALYINREIPPQSNNIERIIVIDVSIKNWGTPKTIAYALMVAIANHPKTDIVCRAFLVGDNFHKISINNIDEIIESFQIVEASLHSAKGLEKLLKEYPFSSKIETVFITSNDAFKQASLQKIMQDNREFFNYWMFTDGDGNIDVYKRVQKSKKHIQQILLPLNEIWQKENKNSYNNENVNEDIIQYPILFPLISNYKKIIATNDNEVFCIASDIAVLRHYDNKVSNHLKGWKLIYNNNSPKLSGEFEIGKMKNGEYVLLVFKIQTKELFFINLSTGKTKMTYFNDWSSSQNSSFIFNNSFQIFHYKTQVTSWTFDNRNEDEKIEILRESPDFKDSINNLYQQKALKQKEIEKKMVHSSGILKNIQTITINEENNLVFNTHQLTLNHHHIIKLKQPKNNSNTKNVEALKQDDNHFVFPNGSSVFVNRLGMLVFQAPKSTLNIYVPSVLNMELGVATEIDFAGNKYFLSENEHKRDILSTERFWIQYIKPFIQNILDYGA